MAELTRLGHAKAGFPVNGAAWVGDRLVVVSRNLVPIQVAVLDADGRRAHGQLQIPVGLGAWAVAPGRDVAWIAPFGAAGQRNVYRLRPADLDLRAVASIDANMIWDAVVGHDGTLYAVTGATVVRVDPDSGQVSDLGVVEPGREFARSVTIVGRTLVVGGRRDGRALLRALHLDTGNARSILPRELADHHIVYALHARNGRVAVGTSAPDGSDAALAMIDLARGGPPRVGTAAGASVVDAVRVVGTGAWGTLRPSGAVGRFLPGDDAVVPLATGAPDAEHVAVTVERDRVWAVAITARVWSVSTRGGDCDATDLVADGVVEAGPELAQSLAVSGGRAFSGGSFSLQRRDLDSGALRHWFTPGEPKALAVVDGTCYLAVYPVGQLHVADEHAEQTRLLARLPESQNRPIALEQHPGRGLLLATSASDRHGAGAFHRYELATGRLRSAVNPLGAGEHPAGIALAGDTVIIGGSGNDPSLLAWDLGADREAWRVTGALPGGGVVIGLVHVGGRVHGLTSRGWAFSLDLPARRVVRRVRISNRGGRVVAVRRGLFGVDYDTLWRLHPATLEPETIISGLGSRVWGWPFMAADPDGQLYVIAGTDLARVRF